MTSITAEATTLLSQLYSDKHSWASLTGFTPFSVGFDDSNRRRRYLALLALHASHAPHSDEQASLIAYLLDEETRYHQHVDHYCTSISLAAYLSATRVHKPSCLWGIWVTRQTNFDASKCVDVHYMYYAAGSLDGAKSYVQNCTDIREVVGEGEGRMGWWLWMLEDHGGDEAKALEALKKDVCARIEHDRKCGMTDGAVQEFVEGSWRRDTQSWSESLLPEEVWSLQ